MSGNQAVLLHQYGYFNILHNPPGHEIVDPNQGRNDHDRMRGRTAGGRGHTRGTGDLAQGRGGGQKTGEAGDE